MAQKRIKLDQETFFCSMCLELLEDPVTIPCGHNYCMNCINTHWDVEDEDEEMDEEELHRCPQCRQTFNPRPALVRNTMLADLVKQESRYAEPEDVACDVCTGRRLKATKSCLVCLVSYCQKHIQPHYNSPTFENHNLVNASNNVLGNMCSIHNEVMTAFCRSHQQCVCYSCITNEHKHHDIVSAAAERTKRQRELEENQGSIRERIQNREGDVKMVFHQVVEDINLSADELVEHSEKIFTELIGLLEKRSSDVKQQVRSRQRSEVSEVKELQEKLEQEITELKRYNSELQKLSHTEDLNQFLHNYPYLSSLNEFTGCSECPASYFEDVTAAVSDVRDKLQDVLRDKWTNCSLMGTEVDVLLFQPEPKTRAGFLEISDEITLDPNTANIWMLLSDGNRKAAAMWKQQSYSSHPERFADDFQVLGSQSLTERCYWEVEWGKGGVCVAVAYEDIKRERVWDGDEDECLFGCNDKSWALTCDPNGYYFQYNKVQTPVSGPQSSRVGVYLDHTAGILSFYSISETMTLLHRVQTTFTQPLYAGLRLFYYGSSAELCKLK